MTDETSSGVAEEQAPVRRTRRSTLRRVTVGLSLCLVLPVLLVAAVPIYGRTGGGVTVAFPDGEKADDDTDLDEAGRSEGLRLARLSGPAPDDRQGNPVRRVERIFPVGDHTSLIADQHGSGGSPWVQCSVPELVCQEIGFGTAPRDSNWDLVGIVQPKK